MTSNHQPSINAEVTGQKQVAIVTATRAEYGLLSNLIRAVDDHPKLALQLYVTGSHLLPEQGMTIDQIRRDGHEITAEVPILTPGERQTDLQVSLATANALKGFALAFEKFRPDILVVLGDRYELLGICSAALLAHIPIVHIHGGEVTEGAMDEAIRHAVTKLAHLHFVAAEAYRQRVIQMGEQPDRVFNVGAPGLDVIQNMDYLSKQALEDDLGMSFSSPLFLVTYHPVSWGKTEGMVALENLFKAIENFPHATVIWTAANTDASGDELNHRVREWVAETNINAEFVTSLGSQRYLSLMKLCDAVIGNSSSGIIEAPAMGVPTINIGERQAGRLRAASIIDCDEGALSIEQAIEHALSQPFQALLSQSQSVYGQGESSQKMVEILEATLFSDSKTFSAKSFYDLESHT